MSNYSVKFYAESIKCEEDECNFTINNTTCISNSEDLFRDIWICENPNSKGLITAKIKCSENEIAPGNTCYLRYRFNVPVVSPDTGVHPPPIHTDPTTEFLSNLFFFSVFGFVIISILVGFIRACFGDPSSRGSDCHPHPTNYTVVNGQGFCDNPSHFITNNNSDAPPPYEAVNNGSSASTPLLSGGRSKHCIDPRCPNYLKPYLPRSGIYSQGYQSIPPPILISNPGYDYYNEHGHHGHHSNHHGHNNGFFHDHGHHGHNSHHNSGHHGHGSHHNYY
ncbi:hypothetical protein CONCODRAFT_83810 [Conidiobolus coronatus NRRL 28638]|uniref:Uncharacterized protein n=1 Tax=Conidiobolus coronatus (strain ATCC 28846 / CBS 209.66 / NRRL 28638) TaxID=796925 RepID=A0A137PD43_CONC2|nr:hypothetical protein CONCODRAFT_83810 [Conidiobolus coronatus NRRL 28638]|eukprot:KXN72861.1 hypothetical protein CONCODRAFT_83810 [Conidiobolus coronatus NRRL 28638]